MGFAMAAELIAAPKGDRDANSRDGNALGMRIYREMIENASTLGGHLPTSWAIKMGLITEYRWADDLDALIDALIAEGPVILYVSWYPMMDQVTEWGRFRVPAALDAIDPDKGGFHAVLIRGYDPAKKFRKTDKGQPAFLIRNSWGKFWGDEDGDAWITASDLDRLVLHSRVGWESSAVVPMGRKSFDVKTVLATPLPKGDA